MIIWRGWGVLAFVYAAVAMMLFGGLMSTVVSKQALPFSMAIGLILAAVATWFTGVALNRTAPQRKIDTWSEQRRAQLDELVATGGFSLGPGQPQPRSEAEARQMADALFQHEQEQAKGLMNRHSMFWLPLQYWAFVWAALALAVVVLGITTLGR